MKKEKADLLQGTLELLLLRLLRSGSLNGWDIMQRLQLVSGEVLSRPETTRSRTQGMGTVLRRGRPHLARCLRQF